MSNALTAARRTIPTTYHPTHPRFGRKVVPQLAFCDIVTTGAPQPTGEAAPVTPKVAYAKLVALRDYVAAGGEPKSVYADLPPSPPALSCSPTWRIQKQYSFADVP